MTSETTSKATSDGTSAPEVLRLDELWDREGEQLGVSAWHEILQQEVNQYGALTGDEQYIHVDQERAKQTPFGGTIAHGFHTLGRFTGMLWEIFTVEGAETVLNYGLNRVRFPHPAPVGGRLRLRLSIDEVDHVAGGVQVVYGAIFEVEGQPKPVCVAEVVFRYYLPSAPEAASEPGAG